MTVQDDSDEDDVDEQSSPSDKGDGADPVTTVTLSPAKQGTKEEVERENEVEEEAPMTEEERTMQMVRIS